MCNRQGKGCIDLQRRITGRQNSIAKVAMGRNLGVRLFWMWQNGCEYLSSLEFGSYVGQLGTGDGTREFELVILVEVVIEEMNGSD